MNRLMNHHGFLVGCCFLSAIFFAAGLVGPGRSVARAADFEDLSLDPNSFYNGSDGAGGFTSDGATFTNQYSSQYNSWRGWSYSNMTNRQTPGYVNQYSAYPGSGAGGSSNYGVAFLGSQLPQLLEFPGGIGGTGGTGEFSYSYGENVTRIELPEGTEPVSMQVANTTYAALSMQQGDGFAKKFGGASGEDPDFFKLSILGLDADGVTVVGTGFTLADYGFEDSAQDYIREGWSTVDLSNFRDKGVVAIEFSLQSSDIGPYGMNTPAYFAMDNLILGESPTENPLATDLNRDGVVSRGDLMSLLPRYGSDFPNSLVLGDLSIDGKIGLADLAMIQSDFGRFAIDTEAAGAPGPGVPGPAAVPEPATLLTLVIGFTALFGSRRRRRHCSEP